MSEIRRSGSGKRAKRWTKAEAREVVTRWKGSRQSATGFATQHHLSASRLSYWSKRLDLQAAESPQFVAVAVGPETSATHAVEIAIGGLTLRVREGVDTGFVAQLVSALQSRSIPLC